MNDRTSNELQTPAGTPAEQLAAGHGGSYTLDPRTGSVTLNARTEQAIAVSRYPAELSSPAAADSSVAPESAG
jgi:hypothetical protein